MFIVGGFNAYPAEIEELLLHPDVADVAVIGVPDARLGEVGKAYVVRAPGRASTADDLIAWARERWRTTRCRGGGVRRGCRGTPPARS